MAGDMELRLRINADGTAAVASLRQVRQAVEDVGPPAGQSTQALGGLTTSLAGIARQAAGLVGLAALGALAKDAIATAEAYQRLEARMRDATRATGDYAKVMAQLTAISNANGVDLEESVGLFQSLARSAPELGATTAEMLKLTDLVQKLGVIGGASTQAMSAGLMQLSQGLAAGTLRAEEMNSLLENLPAVAEAIARGLGMSVGELRAAVLEGKVLSEQVLRALLSQAGDVEKRFKQVGDTISAAATAAANEWARAWSNIDQALGLSDLLAASMRGVAAAGSAIADALDPKKLSIAAVKAEIDALQDQLASQNNNTLQGWLFGQDPAAIRAQIAGLAQDLAELQGLTEHAGANPLLVFDFTEASTDLEYVIRQMDSFNTAADTAAASTRNISRAAQDATKDLSLMGRAMALIDKEFTGLDEEAARRYISGGIDPKAVLEERKNAEKRAAEAARDYASAQREAVAAERNRATQQERQLQLAAQYGSSSARATLFQRRVEEVTAAMQAQGDTAEEIALAINQVEEEFSAEVIALERYAASLGVASAQQLVFERATAGLAEKLRAVGATEPEISRAIEEIRRRTFGLKEAFDPLAEVAKTALQRLDGAFLSLWQSVLSGASDFGATLKRFILNLLAELAHAVTTKQIVIQLSAALGIGGSAQAVAGGATQGATGSLLGNLMGSAANYVIGGIGGFGSLITSLGGAIGSSIVSGVGTGLSMAMTNIGAAGFLGGAGATLGMAGSSLMSGAFGTAIGTAIGATAPYLLPLVGVGALLKSIFGRKEAPEFDFRGALGEGYAKTSRVNEKTDVQLDNLVQTVDKLVEAALGERLANLVREAGKIDSTAHHLKKGEEHRIYDAIKERISNMFAVVDGAFATVIAELPEVDTPEALMEQLAGVFEVVTNIRELLAANTGGIQELLGVQDLEGVIRMAASVRREDELLIDAMQRVAVVTPTVAAALDQLGLTLGATGTAAVEIATALAEAAGGLEGFGGKAAFFYENFYTEEERAAKTVDLATRAIAAFNAEMGITGTNLIDTKEELRAFVEGLDLTTEAGREALIAAMDLAPTIVTLDQALETLGQGAESAADSIEEANARIDASIKSMTASFEAAFATLSGGGASKSYWEWEQEAVRIAAGFGTATTPDELETQWASYVEAMLKAFELAPDEVQGFPVKDAFGKRLAEYLEQQWAIVTAQLDAMRPAELEERYVAPAEKEDTRPPKGTADTNMLRASTTMDAAGGAMASAAGGMAGAAQSMQAAAVAMMAAASQIPRSISVSVASSQVG